MNLKYLSIVAVLIFVISSNIGVFAQDDDQTTTVKTKINLANIPDIEQFNYLKIVGYLNGKGKIKYIDLDEFFLPNENERSSNDDNNLVVNLEFNKKNDISSVMSDDEYFVCAYFMNDILNNPVNENSISTINEISLYDCDEGNIGDTNKDSVNLFYTLKKYDKSLSYYNLNKGINDLDETNNDIKIIIKVPIYDSKDIELMNVVAMIRGEYQIKTIDVDDELNYKKDSKSTDKMIIVPFIFERGTESGNIQK
ncbi:MAG: hypothetical protein ACPKPY_02365 [Nitrososphaeraceae archaeon]